MTKRSGPNLTDARRAKLGYGRLTLRLPEHTLAQLADLAHERGVTRAQLVAELVERASQRTTS
jgi:predicted DNA-binding ribbon-helix-helix protein